MLRTRVEYRMKYTGQDEYLAEKIAKHLARNPQVSFSKKEAEKKRWRFSWFLDNTASWDDLDIYQTVGYYSHETFLFRYWTAFKEQVRTNEVVSGLLFLFGLTWVIALAVSGFMVLTGEESQIHSSIWWSLLVPAGLIAWGWGVGSLMFMEPTEDVRLVQEEAQKAENLTLTKV